MPKLLVIAEHEDGQLKLATLSAVAFAAKVASDTAGSFEIFVLGEGVGTIAEGLRNYGASAVCCADDVQLKHAVADRYAKVSDDIAREHGATMIVAAASTFSKDILPRGAALLDAGMLSDVIEAQPDGDDFTFRRVMFAGNVIATVKLSGAIKFLTIRPAAFAHAQKQAAASPLTTIAVNSGKLPSFVEWVGREAKASGRPDSTEARVEVSVGRATNKAEDFGRLIG